MMTTIVPMANLPVPIGSGVAMPAWTYAFQKVLVHLTSQSGAAITFYVCRFYSWEQWCIVGTLRNDFQVDVLYIYSSLVCIKT